MSDNLQLKLVDINKESIMTMLEIANIKDVSEKTVYRWIGAVCMPPVGFKKNGQGSDSPLYNLHELEDALAELNRGKTIDNLSEDDRKSFGTGYIERYGTSEERELMRAWVDETNGRLDIALAEIAKLKVDKQLLIEENKTIKEDNKALESHNRVLDHGNHVLSTNAERDYDAYDRLQFAYDNALWRIDRDKLSDEEWAYLHSSSVQNRLYKHMAIRNSKSIGFLEVE
jgi:hypothetical protein